jgi:hypothetical protein
VTFLDGIVAFEAAARRKGNGLAWWWRGDFGEDAGWETLVKIASPDFVRRPHDAQSSVR